MAGSPEARPAPVQDMRSASGPVMGIETRGDINSPRSKADMVLQAWQNAPIKNIPPIYTGERAPINETQLGTARHELRHALVALAHGVKPTSVSVIREGNSLGRNEFNSFIPLTTFKIIAAAGAINEEGGGGYAPGSGGDLYQIASANYLQGMNPENFQSYISMAKNTLNAHFPPKVRERAAIILAHMGKVNGDQISSILEQARFELALEDMLVKGNFDVSSNIFDTWEGKQEAEENILNLQNSLTEESADLIGLRSIEEDLEGNIRIGWTSPADPQSVNEDIICPFCGPVKGGAHADFCQQAKYRTEIGDGTGNSGEKIKTEAGQNKDDFDDRYPNGKKEQDLFNPKNQLIS
ncbi:MAG: hypothetical protein UV73_C0018G0029 [Candidatus Gottesmanbacteria bacterium GW2011_GWA2_43_14]|uniref:Uncharacterized protein n=1 Tax=Candidatus Gottesmanbacteria bacterium GW2011_GWA2_43_14 TaxID=1618443 RepID=A0A0G1FJX8_9BACT|nr:MAG: hypothetical protein UV73_C0018G0029 [Candidatus Gottesmanbacteria bacterium GW2011_GWA2_43_14]